MTIEWEAYIDKESMRIIHHILMNTDIRTVMNKDLQTILLAAREKSHKNGFVYVTNGVHTNFSFMKKAAEYGSFTPFWFDVEAEYKGKDVLVDNNRRMHIYVAKYMLAQDYMYNVYWHRVNIEPDESRGYSPVYSPKTMYMNEMWAPTGTVTGNFYRDEEIIMSGGGPHTKSKKKVPVVNDPEELPEEKIPVILTMPRNKKEESSMFKKFKKSLMNFRQSISRKK